MTMRYVLFTAAAFCLLAGSCKKDDDNTGTNNVAEYVKLTPGNYWVYESYIVDPAGNATPGSVAGPTVFYDSVYVEKDTLINKYAYHKLMKPISIGTEHYEPTFLRDSLNYEVDQQGMIVLAPDDYRTIFHSATQDANQISNDSALHLTVRMADKNKMVTTPAGIFTTVSLDNIWTFYPYAAQQQPTSERRQHFRYAKGVGMVSETMPIYASYPNYEERRLIRYSVK